LPHGFNIATGQLIQTFEGQTSWVNAVTFSSEGTQLLSGGFDQAARLWDASTGQLVGIFKGTRRG
jgi:WD40 repeat protein